MIALHLPRVVGLTVGNFPSGDVEGSIAALQANIENGISVDSSRRALRVLLRSQAGCRWAFESLSLSDSSKNNLFVVAPKRIR